MDHLKEGIGLRGYGQKDPLVAYKKESFDMFEGMMGRFQEDTARYLFRMQIIGPDERRWWFRHDGCRFRLRLPSLRPALDGNTDGNGHRESVPLVRRELAAETTIDSIEREFRRKKERELEHARLAGGGEETRRSRSGAPATRWDK